jgi:hypothetical protein
LSKNDAATPDMEECLRKLMVPLRSKIESKQTYERATVSRLLNLVYAHALKTQDIRFIDCVNYYGELGFSLDGEAEI